MILKYFTHCFLNNKFAICIFIHKSYIYSCFHSQFSTPEAVLEGARYMVAMQIAREPLVRHVLRQTFQERAKINIKPTKKGKKVGS